MFAHIQHPSFALPVGGNNVFLQRQKKPMMNYPSVSVDIWKPKPAPMT